MNWLNLFIETPGDFLYFLVVIALCQTTLMLAWGFRRLSPQNRAARRYTLAGMGLVAAWLVLFVGALFSLASRQDARAILPPLERAVMLVSVLLVGWAFLTADHNRWTQRADIAILVALALTCVGYIVTAMTWAGVLRTIDFNLLPHSPAWAAVTAIASLLIAIIALVGLRDVRDVPLKAVFFGLVFVGHLIALIGTARGAWIGDYLGSARLTWVMAFSIVPITVYRLVAASWAAALIDANKIRMTATQSVVAVGRTGKTGELTILNGEKHSTQEIGGVKLPPIETQSSLLLKFLGLVLEAASPSSIPELIVTAALDGLHADVGALLRVQDANYADFTYVYDKTRGRTRAGMALNLDHQPTLVNAMERREQRTLYMDRNTDELEDLYTRLDLEQMGPVYLQPLVRQSEVVAILMIAMPYAARELSSQERELLKSMATISSNLLAISYQAQEASLLAEERAIQAMVEGVAPGMIDEKSILAARQEMQVNLQAARNQISMLNRQVTSLTLALDDERTRIASLLGGSGQDLSISQRLIALNDEQKSLREERDTLMQRLQEVEATLSGATAGDGSILVNNIAEAAHKEQAALQHERDRLQEALNTLRLMSVNTPDEVQTLLTQMQAEQSRLIIERSQLQEKLNMLETQLHELGLSGSSTVHTNVINHLYEERANLQSRLDALQKERDTLLSERTRMASTIQTEKERETSLHTMETQLQNLAADREAALKQRDKFRAERDELVEKVNVVKVHRAQLMAQSAGLEMELGEANEEQARLRVQVQTLSDEKSELLLLRDGLNAEMQRLQMGYEQLTARAEGDAARMQRLSEEGVNSLKQMVDELLQDRKRLEQELSRARGALGDTEYQLSISQKMAAIDLDNPPPARTYAQQPDLLISLVQELRTPMTSIQGYVELLLGESVGILGASQRRFLQRVSANVSRLATMLDDLVRMTALDTGHVRLTPTPVDVVHLIENAITNAAVQFREKGLTVNFSLQDDLPAVNADEDALTQIIAQLLTNAYLVSPPDSELFIRAYARRLTLQDQSVDCAFVSIEDRGGGIPPEDVARVFARKYKAENPLIEGLGDTGVGLSIARALVEAHSGQLWLESKVGVGSIFSFALPIQPMVER